ncbi:MAG: bifunctional phosphopantothenoylcysteine decarboxylase/phosphopantothenate--cysteine ligase CoaBC [Oscillospiraceae bacterium]|jgi:phosphopantothenoylcysteine decarboxylase/phosphopantothenate--cysteine ligase|nr:bifunctional phosphopantothenoylcysteine decarboxylase/phosphopantothenate--cysteine ligase CoaBC [Oscillospiraceae bacterium]
MLLQNKTILLGVTGSIAAYKAAALASRLTQQGAAVHTLLTKNGAQFVGPVTFEGVTGQKCVVDTFDRTFQYSVEHIALAKQADLVLIAPATANVIAKLANGLADDMLTTTVLACRCPKMIAPAMNTGMYENPVTQDNLKKLQHYGWKIIAPACGRLACGDVGAGKFPEPADILQDVLQVLAEEKDMAGLHVLVTAGPTQEALDPVRYLTNHSTGKMGYELARSAARRGADVTLVSGPTSLAAPTGVRLVPVCSAQEMFSAVTAAAPQQDLLAFAAAVADYRPQKTATDKIKKGTGVLTSLPLTATPDILQYIGEHRRPGQLLCGFSMETRDLVENSRKKLVKKHADMIAANNLKVKGAGFGTSTNVMTLITTDHTEELPLLSKYETAGRIWSTLLQMRRT